MRVNILSTAKGPVVALLLGFVLVGCGDQQGSGIRSTAPEARDLSSDGCAQAEDPIELPSQHTDYQNQWGAMPSDRNETEPVSDDQLNAMGLPSRLRELPAAGLLVERGGEAETTGIVFYLDSEPTGLTTPEIMDRGGIQVQVSDADGEDLSSMDKMFPDRMIDVQIGAFPGRLYWADPDETGARMYGAYWATDQKVYSVLEREGPAFTLNTARAIACPKG